MNITPFVPLSFAVHGL